MKNLAKIVLHHCRYTGRSHSGDQALQISLSAEWVIFRNLVMVTFGSIPGSAFSARFASSAWPRHSVRGNRHSKSRHPVRFRPQCHCCPFRGLLVSPGDEMRKCHGALREEYARVKGIEPHGFVEAFDRAFGIASVAADPAASLPGDSQIHVQLKCAIDQQECTIYFFERRRRERDLPNIVPRHHHFPLLLHVRSDSIFPPHQTRIANHLPWRTGSTRQPNHRGLQIQDLCAMAALKSFNAFALSVLDQRFQLASPRR